MVRRTLCGVVDTCDKHSRLASDDVVVVNLCDITLFEWTRVDFPHIPHRYLISNTVLENNDFFPIPFTIYYNEEEIDKDLCYGIRCDIFDREKNIKFSSERFIPVLTDKHPKTNVYITVGPRTPSITTPLKTIQDQSKIIR